jgi:hypothetical protein
MSLDSADRHILVRQSAETWLDEDEKPIAPEPVDARKLYLSAAGAWLDAIGAWTTLPYSEIDKLSIESWEHIAPMGRDQFVKVVYPGYLFPFGHRASLVKLTERKMKDASPSVAGLFQRKFLIIKQPLLRYSSPDFPITEIRVAPIVTPTLSPDPGPLQNTRFVPHVDNAPFQFILHMRDKEDRPLRVTTPLVWVAEQYTDAVDIRTAWKPNARVAFNGQKVAYAAVRKGGDTIAKTDLVTFDAAPFVGGSTPTMVSADVTIDAVEQLSGVGPSRIAFFQKYLDHGFGGPNNAGEVWAQLVRDQVAGDPFAVVPDAPKVMSFGQGAPSGSDKAGGFLQPNVAIGGLSRLKGTVNDLDSVATGDFDPVQFLGSALPKLFGVVELVDLLKAVGVDLNDAPDLVSETLDRIESFTEDLQRAKRLAQEAVDEANRLVRARTAEGGGAAAGGTGRAHRRAVAPDTARLGGRRHPECADVARRSGPGGGGSSPGEPARRARNRRHPDTERGAAPSAGHPQQAPQARGRPADHPGRGGPRRGHRTLSERTRLEQHAVHLSLRVGAEAPIVA